MKLKNILLLLSIFFATCNSDEPDELEDLGIEELSHAIDMPSKGGIKTLVSEGNLWWITFIDINDGIAHYLDNHYFDGGWFILEDLVDEGIRITAEKNKTGKKRSFRVGLQLRNTNRFNHFFVHQESE